VKGDSIKPPLVRQESVRASVPLKETATPMSRSSSCVSVQSVSSSHSEQQGTPKQIHESSPLQGADQEVASKTLKEKVTESARKKVKKGLKKASSNEAMPASEAIMSLEEVRSALDIPEGPLKDFVDLLWQENQMLKELVAKIDKDKAYFSFSVFCLCLCLWLTSCSFSLLEESQAREES